jgi:hypothetical protein
MAAVGLTEQLLLRRALAASPHYAACHAALEDSLTELSAGAHATQQGLPDEGFASDDEADYDIMGAGAPRAKAAQGRIECVASAPAACDALLCWC